MIIDWIVAHLFPRRDLMGDLRSTFAKYTDEWGRHVPDWYSGVCTKCGRSGGDTPNHFTDEDLLNLAGWKWTGEDWVP